jgi:Bacterial membrane protein YfhO
MSDTGEILQQFSVSADSVALPKKTLPHIFHRLVQKDAHWVVLLLLLNLAFFGDALFTDKTFFVRDVSFFHYPLKKLVTEAYARGEWPLWNPYIQLGQPLLANPNSMAFYPTQILFQLLPFEVAFDLHFVLHCMLAGIATFYLGRALGLPGHSAFLSAAVYNFGGVTLSFLNLFNILPVVAILPLLAVALVLSLRSFSILKLAATSFLFGVFFLLLEPLSSIAVALFLILLLTAVFLFSPETKVSFIKGTAFLLVAVLSGLLLASVQILPTSELIQHSGRKGGVEFEVASFWSFHPLNSLQVIFPRIFGEYFKLAQPAPWGNTFFDNREPYLLSCYLGIFPLLLGLWAVCFSKHRWITNLLIGTSLVAALLAMGKYTPIYSWLFHYCPPFRYGRFPVKYLLVVNLCFSLLAGFGLDRVEDIRKERTSSRGRRNIGIALFVLFVLTLLIVSLSLSFGNFWSKLNLQKMDADHLYFNYRGQMLQINKPLIYGSLKHAQILLGGFLLFIMLVCWKKVRLNIIRGAVVNLVLFDLFIHNFWINPLIRADFYEPAPAAMFLQEEMKRDGLARIHSIDRKLSDFLMLKEKRGTTGRPAPTVIGRDLSQNPPAILGRSDSVAWVSIFRKLTLFQFLSAKDHIHYSVFNPIDRLETLPSQLISRDLARIQTLEEKLYFLGGLNVGYILSIEELKSPLLSLEALFEINSDRPLRIYKLANKLPRAFLVDSDESLDKNVAARDGGYMSVGAVGKPGGQTALRSWAGNGLSSGSNVVVTQYTPSRVEVQAASDRKGLLVLLDSYYPGWRARVDGQETTIDCIGNVYRGIEFPPGKHHVTFTYEPNSFRYGLWISLLTLFGWIAACVLSFVLQTNGDAAPCSDLKRLPS